jgi:cell division protein FtsW (lipid II flippase)
VGHARGCGFLLAASLIDYERFTSRLAYVPLLAGVLLSIALIAFGTGPTGSDAKVNLLGFQPVEAIKPLIVLFLAGYLARRWEALRELREERPGLGGIGRWFSVPRLDHVLPVVACVALALLFFFLQKDLGPALVMSCVFLTLYGVARRRVMLVTAGLGAIASGFAVGYLLGTPATVATRIHMWLSPWDNMARGGDQIAHSLWALSSGGTLGAGLGLGRPGYVPAGHTDLILACAGEELGFVGLAALALVFALLIHRGIAIARASTTDYGFFLALGLTALLAFQLLLVAGGLLGLVPSRACPRSC